jgi:hypothetical protein
VPNQRAIFTVRINRCLVHPKYPEDLDTFGNFYEWNGVNHTKAPDTHINGALTHSSATQALFAERGFELGKNLSITVNPSQEFIRARMDELYNEPEITNVGGMGPEPIFVPESRLQTSALYWTLVCGLLSLLFRKVKWSNSKPAEMNPTFRRTIRKRSQYAWPPIVICGLIDHTTAIVQAFTLTLDTSTASTPLEIHRTTLCNRCQSYSNLGDVNLTYVYSLQARTRLSIDPEAPLPTCNHLQTQYEG